MAPLLQVDVNPELLACKPGPIIALFVISLILEEAWKERYNEQVEMNKNVEMQIAMLNEKMKEFNMEIENSGILPNFKSVQVMRIVWVWGIIFYVIQLLRISSMSILMNLLMLDMNLSELGELMN